MSRVVRGRRVGEDRRREGDGRPPRATQLVRDDRGPGDHDQHDREHVQSRGHRGQRAARPDRVHERPHDHHAPQRELCAVVEAVRGQAAGDVAVGEERHDGRRRDDRAAPDIAQDDREHGPHEGGPGDRPGQRRHGVDREHQREVGRVQEQDRVRREQQRVDGDPAQEGHRAPPARLTGGDYQKLTIRGGSGSCRGRDNDVTVRGRAAEPQAAPFAATGASSGRRARRRGRPISATGAGTATGLRTGAGFAGPAWRRFAALA